jgi:hypothetical protein
MHVLAICSKQFGEHYSGVKLHIYTHKIDTH